MLKFTEKINSIFGVVKQKEDKGYEVWVVYWYARFGDYCFDTRRVSKAFLTKEDARLFAKSLKDAHKLLQNTNNIGVYIEKQK